MTPEKIGMILDVLNKRLMDEAVSFQNALSEKKSFQNLCCLYFQMSYTLEEIKTIQRYTELVILPS